MNEVIDLKPGVDFFPSKRERRLRNAGVTHIKPRRTLPSGGTGKRMPVSINVAPLIDAIAPQDGFTRDLLILIAKEWPRVRH